MMHIGELYCILSDDQHYIRHQHIKSEPPEGADHFITGKFLFSGFKITKLNYESRKRLHT